MYSPKIAPEFIPILYKIGKVRNKPMTIIVQEALDQYLKLVNVPQIEKQFQIMEDSK